MLPLSPEVLRATYKMLDVTQPFCKWNLPDADEVTFRVVRDPARRGFYRWMGSKHLVAISSSCVGHTNVLVETMAHEMIHVHEEHSNFSCANSEHSAAFKKLAARVCYYHGFDPKAF